MKKFVKISVLSLALGVALTACAPSEVDDIFDQSAAERLEASKAYYTDILTDRGGKWQMEYFTTAEEPGYIYLFTFDKNGSVVISGQNKQIGALTNINNPTPTYGSATSLWEVITDNGPVLSLNSYNPYFHLFANPEDDPLTQSVDEQGYGHNGDYEFDLMKYSGDTLYLVGKKNYMNIIMTRVDASVDDKVYMQEVVDQASNFFSNKIPEAFLTLPDGKRWILTNGSTQIIDMYPEGGDPIIETETYNTIITHDGLTFMNTLNLGGYKIKNFTVQPDGSLLCRDDGVTRIASDVFSTVFNYKSITWNVDTETFTGELNGLYTALTTALKSYKMQGVSFLYDTQITDFSSSEDYVFRISASAGSRKLVLDFHYSATKMADNQIKLALTGMNTNAQKLYNNTPAIKNFIDAIFEQTITLSSENVLSPVHMIMSDASGSFEVNASLTV